MVAFRGLQKEPIKRKRQTKKMKVYVNTPYLEMTAELAQLAGRPDIQKRIIEFLEELGAQLIILNDTMSEICMKEGISLRDRFPNWAEWNLLETHLVGEGLDALRRENEEGMGRTT